MIKVVAVKDFIETEETNITVVFFEAINTKKKDVFFVIVAYLVFATKLDENKNLKVIIKVPDLEEISNGRYDSGVKI